MMNEKDTKERQQAKMSWCLCLGQASAARIKKVESVAVALGKQRPPNIQGKHYTNITLFIYLFIN